MVSTFSRLAIVLGLCSYVIAAPLNHLEARANCADGKEAPCICNNALGLRQTSSTLRNNCGNKSFKFTNPSSGTDGTVSLVSGNTGSVQCDQCVVCNGLLWWSLTHILQYRGIAIHCGRNSQGPRHLHSFPGSGGSGRLSDLFQHHQSPPNTVFVEGTVNNAKGVAFGGKSFSTTSQKAANGVVSYLTLLEANGATTAADSVNPAMTTAVGAGNPGFQAGFQTRFNAAVKSAISTSKAQAPNLPPPQHRETHSSMKLLPPLPSAQRDAACGTRYRILLCAQSPVKRLQPRPQPALFLRRQLQSQQPNRPPPSLQPRKPLPNPLLSLLPSPPPSLLRSPPRSLLRSLPRSPQLSLPPSPPPSQLRSPLQNPLRNLPPSRSQSPPQSQLPNPPQSPLRNPPRSRPRSP
ncbi:hypothetical protein B0H12DRAFT_62433 [Mycena haematopus]|nr:hypothetical protein B0H12DRAFT_62433 [Mycena haematopus]